MRKLKENKEYKRKAGIKRPAFFYDKMVRTEWIAVVNAARIAATDTWVVKKMIINNANVFSNLYTSNALSSTKQAGNVSRTQKTKSFQDEMKISKEAQSFNEMLKKLRGQSEIRQDKVEEYTRKLAEGSYNVESENIAASILFNQF